MKILGITEKNDGCGYHRVMLPIAYMDKDEALITNKFDDETLSQGWDIVLYNRGLWEVDESTNSVWPITSEKMLELKEKYGFKLVVDIDDTWKLDPHHLLYLSYKYVLTNQILDNLRIADLVTVTHERLYWEVRNINPNVAIFRNALPFGEDQFNVKKELSEKTRFIYCGGLTHEKDVALLNGPMKRVYGDKQLRDSIHMVYGGYTDDPEYKNVADRMLSDFTCGLKIPGEIRGMRETAEYMKLYENTDVSMIPLLDTPFNGMKSNLKLLEAAAANNAAIVSKVNPYLDFPENSVLYVEKQSDWYGAVKAFTKFPSYREDFAARLREFCEENYNLRKIGKVRTQFFEHLSKTDKMYI